MGCQNTDELKAKESQKAVRIGGMVTALKLKNTKKGDRYASFILEDWLGTVEAIVWPDVYSKVGHLLESEDPIVVTAKSEIKEGRCTIVIDNIESLIDIRDRNATHGVLALKAEKISEEKIKKLRAIFDRYDGNCPVKASLTIDQKVVSISLRDAMQKQISVIPSEEICDEVEELFGEPALSFI